MHLQEYRENKKEWQPHERPFTAIILQLLYYNYIKIYFLSVNTNINEYYKHICLFVYCGHDACRG